MSARGTSRLLPPMHKWVEFASATGAMAHQITEAFPWNSAPKYLIRDNDRAFGIAMIGRSAIFPSALSLTSHLG
jgi:hypothetical protein